MVFATHDISALLPQTSIISSLGPAQACTVDLVRAPCRDPYCCTVPQAAWRPSPPLPTITGYPSPWYSSVSTSGGQPSGSPASMLSVSPQSPTSRTPCKAISGRLSQLALQGSQTVSSSSVQFSSLEPRQPLCQRYNGTTPLAHTHTPFAPKCPSVSQASTVSRHPVRTCVPRPPAVCQDRRVHQTFGPAPGTSPCRGRVPVWLACHSITPATICRKSNEYLEY